MSVKTPSVWVVGRDHWPRALLLAELSERGFDVRGYESVADAVIDLYRLLRPTPKAVVVDARSFCEDLTMLRALVATSVPWIVIVGAVEAQAPWLGELNPRKVLTLPVSIGEVASCVEEIVDRPGSSQ